MPSAHQDVVIVGAGIFGATAALSLARRGARVTLLEAGPIPNPRASSHDISKMVRMEYGPDVFYTALMEQAFDAWAAWNGAWPRRLLHMDGWLVLSRATPPPDSFEATSRTVLERRGHRLHPLDSRSIAANHPDWGEALAGGFRHETVGWAESAAVVEAVATWAAAAGARLRSDAPVSRLELDDGDGRVVGVVLASGEVIAADVVVVAAGAWTPTLVPWLADRLWVVAQPVFHLLPPDPQRFRPPAFPAFAADIGAEGWYGFPANVDGIVKIANHGLGTRVDPDAPRVFPEEMVGALRRFLSWAIPALQDAPIVKKKVCLYCDSFDSDFFIDRDPDHDGLVVAAGGSGHGFKFAPLLGDVIADAVQVGLPASLSRFAWRELGQHRTESARAVTSSDS